MRLLLLVLSVCSLSACVGPSVPEVSGDWVPVNAYTKEIRKIPLQKPYAYTVLPIDGSLKGLLERWSRDKKLQLNYNVRSDFTLPEALKDFRGASLEPSLAVLDKIYKEKGITIGLMNEDQILVQPLLAEGAASEAAPAKAQ